MTDHNRQLAALFHDIALMYRFQDGKNQFRALAYDKASRIMRDLPEDVEQYLKEETLTEIPGIGESIAHDITEFIKKGRVQRFEDLKKEVPYELMELMDIRGFGPQSLKQIHSRLKLETKDEVVGALQSGAIGKLKGFGKKKVDGMLRSLKVHKTIEERMLLWDALKAGENLVALLKNIPGVKHIELAGSLRRRKETIGDIDILVSAVPSKRRKILSAFTSSSLASRVLARGETKASIIVKETGKQADLRMVDEFEWGSALQYFTGSKEHNIHLRTLAREKGLKISEYGVFSIESGKRIAGKTEEELYKKLGMQIMPPEMREDRGEIELALKHDLPKLVELEDIRGDLQMHSQFSDGVLTLDELVHFVRENFPYEYIAITDHSKASRVAGGMDEKGFLKQLKAIKEINQKLGIDFLKSGAEVDVLSNGKLDLSDELLAQLDWVTASIHSGFTHDNTDRLIKACENPFVCCIGHPTGRLIGKREAYGVDFKHLLEAAHETNTALEINAQPDRMDLNDEMAAEAKKKKVKLVISTDSHRADNFYFMKLGVFVARRAWCTAGDILNTGSWKAIQKFKKVKRKEVFQ
jgi:DNA polymerase (family 10)